MKYLNKIIVIVSVVLIILTVYFLVNWLFNFNSNQNIPQNNDKKLSNRDVAIQEALTNPDKLLRRATINAETYLLTGYDDVFYGDNSKKENKLGQKFGGLIVFKLENGKPILFWESNEYINVGRVGGFMDINSDSIPEIVWEYDLGVTGRNNSFYVYKFTGDGFKVVTPIKTVELTTPSGLKLIYNRTLLGGTPELTYMEDIDGDKIYEILVGDEKNISGDVDNPIYEKYQQIYKYDGDKYYLWKEEKIGEGK